MTVLKNLPDGMWRMVLLSLLLIFVLLPSPAWAGWADNNCWFSGSGTHITEWRKSDAKNYAQRAWKEGYHWGGGCWNDNDQDNQPNDPPETESTHGEGGDCSGFTFKAWALENNYGQNGK